MPSLPNPRPRLTQQTHPAQPTYIFLDESGNLDFSASGTRYFVLTSVTIQRPFPAYEALDAFRYECIEQHTDLEYFHCAEDSRALRAGVFQRIAASLEQMRIDCLIVEKAKTAPAQRADLRFYPEMLGHLLNFVAPQVQPTTASELMIITDALPIKRRRKAVTKGVRAALSGMLPRGVRYRILHHAARSHYGLQIADYCCWAVFRKWERGDLTHYDQIKRAIRSEFEIFEAGMPHYYEHPLWSQNE